MYNVEQFNSNACFCILSYLHIYCTCNKVTKAVYTLIATMIHGTRDTFGKTFRGFFLEVQNLF